MGRIVISTNATLDGVVEDPDGQEGFERGGWFHQHAGAGDFEAWVASETAEILATEALLLGRRSFEWFASRAPAMGERVSQQWADRMNRLPKYVVSSTPPRTEWSQATLLDRDPMAAIAALKQTLDGDILVYGSFQLVRTLVARNLADELRLVLFPVVLGTGRSLFDGTAESKPLRRVALRTLGDGLMHCTYAFAGAA
ncbi:MAG: dihydrofolate reductase family protein [Burkholderiales bacterium]|nr:dihydrofolate reductase family protein [Burkholderiales bacterium]